MRILLLTIMVVFGGQIALACKCIFITGKESADLIFVGKVISKGNKVGWSETVFEVDSVYKGSLGKRVRFKMDYSNCSMSFLEDKRYVVYAVVCKQGRLDCRRRFAVSICSRTEELPVDNSRPIQLRSDGGGSL